MWSVVAGCYVCRSTRHRHHKPRCTLHKSSSTAAPQRRACSSPHQTRSNECVCVCAVSKKIKTHFRHIWCISVDVSVLVWFPLLKSFLSISSAAALSGEQQIPSLLGNRQNSLRFLKGFFFLLILLIGFGFCSKAKVGAFLSTPTLPPNHFMAFLAFLAPSCKENGPFSPHHLVFATINLHNEVGQKKTHGRCQCGGVSPLCQKPPRSRVALTNENQSALCCAVDKSVLYF